MVHSVNMVLGCIASGWERFKRQIGRPERHFATEPGCSFKVKAISRLTVVQDFYRGLAILVDSIMALIWLHE